MAEGEPDQVSYELLQDLLRQERRSNKLSVVPARFWLLVRDFLATATESFRVEQARDPFGRKVMLLTDHVKNARHAAESLWALRERKLAMLALAATKERRRPDGITPEEAELYARLVADLETSRRIVFDEFANPSSVPTAVATGQVTAVGDVASAPTRSPRASSPVEVPLAAVAPAASPNPPPTDAAPALQMPIHVQVPADTKGPQPQLVTIRALGDIPPFVGPDMQTYLLKQGDIATVPPTIANLLVRRQKAAILDV